MSIRQLAVYHSLNLVFKTKRDKKPAYFYEKFTRQFAYSTRLASENRIRIDHKITKSLTMQNFTYKAINLWNELPSEITQAQTLESFIGVETKNQVDLKSTRQQAKMAIAISSG